MLLLNVFLLNFILPIYFAFVLPRRKCWHRDHILLCAIVACVHFGLQVRALTIRTSHCWSEPCSINRGTYCSWSIRRHCTFPFVLLTATKYGFVPKIIS
jgi:hypothetical protein